FQAEDGIRDFHVTGVQTCALPIYFIEAYIKLAELGDLAVTQAAAEVAALDQVADGVRQRAQRIAQLAAQALGKDVQLQAKARQQHDAQRQVAEKTVVVWGIGVEQVEFEQAKAAEGQRESRQRSDHDSTVEAGSECRHHFFLLAHGSPRTAEWALRPSPRSSLIPNARYPLQQVG